MFSPLEQFDAVMLMFMKIWHFDISFTNILLPLLLANVLLFLMMGFYLKAMSLMPEPWQLTLENLYLFVLDLMDQQLGYKGYIYFPFIFSLFFFILTCNLMSMTPFGIALTSHIMMIFFLSLSLGLSMFMLGLYLHNLEFLKIFIPECPFILLPFLILIEMFSYMMSSFSLAIRLSANMMAGHTLVYIMSSFIMNVVYIKFWFFFMLVFLMLAVLLLEVGVAFLQAYVFVMLVCIYLSDSLKTPGH